MNFQRSLFIFLASTSLFAITACGSSTIGGGGGSDGGTGGTGGDTAGLCNGEPSPLSCTPGSCPTGFTCVVDADPETCHPSGCGCEAEGWLCTADCGMGGSSCVPDDGGTTGLCNGVPSSESCTEGSCPAGYTCVTDADPTTCHSSSCSCAAEGWVCTADCGTEGASCVADAAAPVCNGVPSPVSCTETGCPADFVCTPDPDPNTCHPSSCSCSAQGWACTDDCGLGGSTCMKGL